MSANYAPWYAPAGTQRGQLNLFTTGHSSGKSMFAQKLLLDRKYRNNRNAVT